MKAGDRCERELIFSTQVQELMLGESLALLAAFCWAAGAGFYKRSMKRLDPIALNLVRSIPAVIFLLLVAAALGRLSYFENLDPWLTLMVMGASLISWAVGDSLYFLGLRSIGVSRAVPISYSYPLFLLPLSVWFLNETLDYKVIIGTLSIISAIWLISRSMDSRREAARRSRIGVLASLLTSICWAVGVALFKYLMNFLGPIFLAFFRMLIILPFLGLYNLTIPNTRRSLLEVRRRELIFAAIGGIIAVGFGDMVYLMGLDLTEANVAGPLAATTPVFAGVIAAIYLKEKPVLETILGIVLITIGAVLLSS